MMTREKTFMQKRISAAARHLLGARRSGFRLEGLADDFVPGDYEVAYAIQDALIDVSEEWIGGWKIAAGTGPEPVCSPLLASSYRRDGDVLNVAGTMATIVEAEVAVRIGSDLPPRSKGYSEQEMSSAIASLHPSLEILGTRFNPKLSVPQLVVIADLQNNSAVAVGAPKTDWQEIDLSHLGITLTVGDEVLKVDKGPTMADVLSALTWLANGRAHRYGGFKAGQVIITGSRVNTPIGRPGETVGADFGVLGKISLRLV
jgi:2-keto-4-pentenoate hydratase